MDKLHNLRWDVLRRKCWCGVSHISPFMHGNSQFQVGSSPHQQALLHHPSRWCPPHGVSHPQCRPGDLPVFQLAMIAKIDLKATFHLIPVRAVDWMHLGMDTCLLFSFNNYTNALHWIMASNYETQLLYYLDDFLLVGGPLNKDTCWEAMYRVHAAGV